MTGYFSQKINAQGFYSTVQYRVNKRTGSTGQDFSWKKHKRTVHLLGTLEY